MNTRWLAILIAVILAALPSFSGICDLRCASSQDSKPEPAALATCPLHAAGEAGSRPAESSPGPCHGPRDSRGSAVLLAAASSNAWIGLDPSPVFEAFEPAPRLSEATASTSRHESKFGRSPGSSPRRSVLRI